ncbi:MAG TPA: glycosyltransferase family 39 protein [Candidatus Obscuribacterales bacterium]
MPSLGLPGGWLHGSDKRNLILLFVACLALFFLALGSWGFIDPGDGYFSEASREMIERGDYIVPHLNYQIYFSKPILIYWLIIGAYKVFGINEFAARFWSAALATVCVLVTYWTTRCIWNRQAALFAGLALATSPLVVTFARMSLIDMGFAALLGIALCSTAMTLCTESRKWWPVIYISLALAVLDKGPAAAVLYLIGTLGYLITSKADARAMANGDVAQGITSKPDARAFRLIMAKLNLLPGLLIFFAIAVPWYVAVSAATHGLWTQVFFFFENFGRFTGHTNHKVPYWWFYLPVVAYGFFPWSLFLPAALLAPVQDAWRRWRSGATIERVPQESAELLFACWALGVIIFFSLSATKLQTYILPAWPALAVLVGITVERFISREQMGYRTRYLHRCIATLAVLGAIGLLTGIAFAVVSANPAVLTSFIAAAPTAQNANASAKIAHLMQQAAGALAAIGPWMKAGVAATTLLMSVGFLASFYQLHKRNIEACMAILAATAVAACTIGGITFYHIGYRFKNQDAHVVAAAIKDKPGPVALFRDFKPSLVYVLQRPVDSFFCADQLHRRDSANPSGALGTGGTPAAAVQYVIAGPKGAADLMSAFPTQLHVVAHSGDWYAFETTDLLALRLPTLEQSFTQHIDLSGGEYSWGTLPFAGGSKP